MRPLVKVPAVLEDYALINTQNQFHPQLKESVKLGMSNLDTKISMKLSYHVISFDDTNASGTKCY